MPLIPAALVSAENHHLHQRLRPLHRISRGHHRATQIPPRPKSGIQAKSAGRFRQRVRQQRLPPGLRPRPCIRRKFLYAKATRISMQPSDTSSNTDAKPAGPALSGGSARVAVPDSPAAAAASSPTPSRLDDRVFVAHHRHPPLIPVPNNQRPIRSKHLPTIFFPMKSL